VNLAFPPAARSLPGVYLPQAGNGSFFVPWLSPLRNFPLVSTKSPDLLSQQFAKNWSVHRDSILLVNIF